MLRSESVHIKLFFFSFFKIINKLNFLSQNKSKVEFEPIKTVCEEEFRSNKFYCCVPHNCPRCFASFSVEKFGAGIYSDLANISHIYNPRKCYFHPRQPKLSAQTHSHSLDIENKNVFQFNEKNINNFSNSLKENIFIKKLNNRIRRHSLPSNLDILVPSTQEYQHQNSTHNTCDASLVSKILSFLFVDTFSSERLFFLRKINETFCLENASKLTHEFCITFLIRKFIKFFLLKMS